MTNKNCLLFRPFSNALLNSYEVVDGRIDGWMGDSVSVNSSLCGSCNIIKKRRRSSLLTKFVFRRGIVYIVRYTHTEWCQSYRHIARWSVPNAKATGSRSARFLPFFFLSFSLFFTHDNRRRWQRRRRWWEPFKRNGTFRLNTRKKKRRKERKKRAKCKKRPRC